MEILFHENTETAWQDALRLTKQTTVAMESVVPDTKDDIGRILSVRPALYLKSRELRAHAVAVEAEASVTVIYINEAEQGVCSFETAQDFSFVFDLPPEIDADSLFQAALGTVGVQAHLIHSRKLNIDLDACCELIVCTKKDYVASQRIPEDCPVTIHLLEKEQQAAFITNVCEKAVSFSEQFDCSAEGIAPAAILWMDRQMLIRDRQIIGARLLVKGEIVLTLDYLAEGTPAPQRKELRLPFSQLLDLENEDAQRAAVRMEWTHASCDLIDTVEGQKMLNVDLRGLLQVRAAAEKTIRYAADAYCNSMPCTCQWDSCSLPQAAEEKTLRMTGEDSAELPDDFQQLLLSYQSPGRCSVSQGTALVELLCASSDGRMFVIRRTVAVSADDGAGDACVTACRISDFSAVRDGDRMILQIAADGIGWYTDSSPLRRLRSVTLDESSAFDSSASPALTAVWAETETVWELAKLYRSTPEAIEAFNADLTKKPIFIPNAP